MLGCHGIGLIGHIADEGGFGTITLVVPSEFIPHTIDKVVVDSYIRIEGAVVVPRLASDGGTADYSLQLDASTIVVKAEPFPIRLVFVPELSIQAYLQKVVATPTLKTTIAFVIIQVDSVEKSEGGLFEQLTIADGPTALDRATVSGSALLLLSPFFPALMRSFITLI